MRRVAALSLSTWRDTLHSYQGITKLVLNGQGSVGERAVMLLHHEPLRSNREDIVPFCSHAKFSMTTM